MSNMVQCPWCRRRLEVVANKIPFHVAPQGNWGGCVGKDFPVEKLLDRNFMKEWISVRRPHRSFVKEVCDVDK